MPSPMDAINPHNIIRSHITSLQVPQTCAAANGPSSLLGSTELLDPDWDLDAQREHRPALATAPRVPHPHVRQLSASIGRYDLQASQRHFTRRAASEPKVFESCSLPPAYRNEWYEDLQEELFRTEGRAPYGNSLSSLIQRLWDHLPLADWEECLPQLEQMAAGTDIESPDLEAAETLRRLDLPDYVECDDPPNYFQVVERSQLVRQLDQELEARGWLDQERRERRSEISAAWEFSAYRSRHRARRRG